ncbi:MULTISPECIES: flagellar biosynthesis protein FliQ [Marinococcus]|jgi:flagellar biosynthetic protein FliQ|uniref:Flagellar biosynthetic protein FliQ n=1 Tax=Marinococcus halophilus TaxID=1371 RepID=A0A510Y266_MARHA|nr:MULTISPECIES: flagellar biosynthesis protein FliQ [Marinococcus]MDX6152480.1 flagellar biosynthesis protein FliQ [Marinococcus sp. PL1-022]MDZ5781823.1 flagellar biosynthesis protein FliQ [Marinococcus luteus]OZT81451.1 flagellar biosynthetic protein FliQ [Marinococcus halophilus]GEK57408.1 flagellar biosynthetic protein FliQ [Marinococcus halophilus]
MSAEQVMQIAQQGIWMVFLIAGPLLVIALVLGFGVAIFQATTQIQEQTLAFIPKILGVLAAMLVLGPWMLTQLVEYTRNLWYHAQQFIG